MRRSFFINGDPPYHGIANPSRWQPRTASRLSCSLDRLDQLADRGLLAEDWGGDTVMVPVSAKAKTNLDLLLEMILLVAEIQDLKANPTRPAMGTVLEAKLDRGRGPVATVSVPASEPWRCRRHWTRNTPPITQPITAKEIAVVTVPRA